MNDFDLPTVVLLLPAVNLYLDAGVSDYIQVLMLQDLLDAGRCVAPACGLHAYHGILAQAQDVYEPGKVILALGEGVVPFHHLCVEAAFPHVLEAELGRSCCHKFIFTCACNT